MNDIKRVRARWAAGIAVVALAILVQGSLLAFADQPRSDTLQINDTNTVTSLCGFPLTIHEEGTLRTTLFFNGDGQVVRITENWQGVHSTITNPANGRSLTYQMAGHDGFSMHQDGSVTVFSQGVRGIVTVPGSGAITGEAGNTTIRLNMDGTMEVQHSGYFHTDGFGPACDYLQDTP